MLASKAFSYYFILNFDIFFNCDFKLLEDLPIKG